MKRRARGGLALAEGGDVDEYIPPRRGSPKGTRGGGTRFMAEGGKPYEPAGVQLLPWEQIDKYTQAGLPQMAEGGTPPNAMSAMAEFLKNMGSRGAPAGGGGNRPPDARGGMIGMPGGEVDAGMNAATDPRFAAMDPRTRAIAKINERLQQQGSISGAQNATAAIMGRNFGKPGLASLAPSSFTRFMQPPHLADGGRLIDLLKKTGRGDRWDTLREHPMRDATKKDAMFAELRSENSPLILHGGIPDIKAMGPFSSRARRRFQLYDGSRKGDDGYAANVGSLASNWGAKWKPEDLIDLDIAKPMQRQGYGSEALALMLSTLKNENDPFSLFDVKRSAKNYWEGRGAQMKDPSRAFRVKDKVGYDRDGLWDSAQHIPRNNDYVIRPGDFLDNVDKFAEGGEVGMTMEDALGLGAGLGASRLRPRHINRMARPVMRAMSKPVLGVEAVADRPLTGRQSDARFDFARRMTPHPYADLPVHRGQGAWMGENGMEHNPLYSQELPRRMGSLRDDPDAMFYAGQIGENLEQAATPVSRFVPHLMNTPDEANAMMIPGVNGLRLRQIAERAGPDWVTNHRPGNKALMFPLGDASLEAMATKLGVDPRYGRSDQDLDRVLLARKPMGYESGLYREVGAQPRNASFEARERQALAPSADRMLETFKRLSGAK